MKVPWVWSIMCVFLDSGVMCVCACSLPAQKPINLGFYGLAGCDSFLQTPHVFLQREDTDSSSTPARLGKARTRLKDREGDTSSHLQMKLGTNRC